MQPKTYGGGPQGPIGMNQQNYRGYGQTGPIYGPGPSQSSQMPFYGNGTGPKTGMGGFYGRGPMQSPPRADFGARNNMMPMQGGNAKIDNKTIGLTLSIACLLSFFMAWYSTFGVGMSGLDIISHFHSMPGADMVKIFLPTVSLALGGISAFAYISNGNKMLKIAPALGLIFVSIFAIMQTMNGIMIRPGIGVFVCLICSVMLALIAFKEAK